MGLAEKRAVQAFQAEKLGEWQQKLNALTGAELELEILWDEVVKEGYAENFPTLMEENYFLPLEKALQNICADAMGKEAFNAKIKKVKIEGNYDGSILEVEINGNTLKLNADSRCNRHDPEEFTQSIVDSLEEVL